ncbi:TNF receptor-associated factor 6-like [Corticium candelabrum]|uniref:TNF receptor-associated factor 6-like n=1 Tax=Corticium candelabrum TaxID=121492 RepID=UPI002E2754E2|nr:TNF receptor-associated factor 6-like [Corticium candelabrum]
MAAGVDARFVAPLADRHVCPVCLLALREPTVTKCGHLFCNDCVRPLARRGRIVCPVCREEQNESEIFSNNYDKREIMSLKIYCDQQEKGCKWKGELRERETHNETCGYVDVLCKNECGEMVMEKDMESHRKKTCMNRQVKCVHCKTIVTFKCLNDHHAQCEMSPVACEFCRRQVRRGEMNEHVSKDGTCPNSPLECEFSEAGCQFIGNRKEWKNHIEHDTVFHLILLMKHQSRTKALLSATKSSLESSLSATESSLTATKSLLSSTRACLAKKECELENLKSFVTEKVGMPVSQPDICVFEWNITNWSNCKMKSEVDPTYGTLSKPFFTKPKGYRLRLMLYPAGHDECKGSHVSVHVLVYAREYDYDVKLPKRQHCKFSFTLLDQQPDAMNVVVRQENTLDLIPRPQTMLITEDREHALQVIPYTKLETIDDFISYEKLNSRSYIQNNEIFIQFCLQLNLP